MNDIWFSKEAKNWNEALPIGNGFLGAMVFGGIGLERIQVNEDSVWSGGFIDRINPDAKDNLHKIRELLKEEKLEKAQQLAAQSMYGTYPHMRHYQTLGDVWIDFFRKKGRKTVKKGENTLPYIEYNTPSLKGYKRVLDIEKAIGSISYCMDKKIYNREFFSSNPDMVIVYHMEAEEGALDFDVYLTRKDNRKGRGSSYCDGVEVIENQIIRLYGQQGGNNGIGFEFMLMVKSEGGIQSRMGSHIIVEGARKATLYITARTTYRSENPYGWCLKALENAGAKVYETLRKAHLLDYAKYYDANCLCLEENINFQNLSTPERLNRVREGKTDIGLINIYYNYARYLLISSSREHSLPANLQGIWNEDFEPAWGSKYTININIQMNYWMAEKCGLSELHMPLLEHLERMHEPGKKVAEIMYGARGFCCHHNTDIWGDCAPQDNNIAATIWPMGAAWLCLHLIEHYKYTKDNEFIKKFYPILCDSVLFFIDYMFQDEKGYWVTGPSSSPENIYLNEKGECGCLCIGPTMDIEILRELFDGYIKITKELGESEELQQEVKRRLNGLPPLRVGKYGQIQEWQKDYEEMETGHRHISQLYALYPSCQIRQDKTPELAKAAELTLERRLQNGGGHTGWSKAWIVLFYARLGKSEKAWSNLEDLLRNATLDNLFDNHPPFQIDGNFGGACGLLEMLVQDFEDEIFLLPALPEVLKGGKLRGIHTKCGGILNFTWKNHQIVDIKIYAKRNLRVTVVSENKNSHYIELKKGEEFKRVERQEGGF